MKFIIMSVFCDLSVELLTASGVLPLTSKLLTASGVLPLTSKLPTASGVLPLTSKLLTASGVLPLTSKTFQSVSEDFVNNWCEILIPRLPIWKMSGDGAI